MELRVVWDNEEHTMLRYIFPDQWSWEDYYQALEQARAMREGEHHPIGLIYDTPPTMRVPDNFITNARSVIRHKDPSVIHVAVIVNRLLARSLLSVLTQVIGRNDIFTAVSSLEEAHKVLLTKLQENAALQRKG